MKTKVYAFDFDGTLTTKDTLLEFIKFARGERRLYTTLLLFLPLLVLMKLRLYPNWKAKQQVFSFLFRNMAEADFNALCASFAHEKAHLMRPDGLNEIRKALAENSKVMIVSASIDNWVRPFFAEFADRIIVSCTRIEVRNGLVTGKFLTKNCYGEEKVKRIRTAFPYRKTYHLIAFGDSKGDSRMFEYADESHYKPFRKGHTADKDNAIAAHLSDGQRQKLGEIIRFGIVGVAATAIQAGVYCLLVSYFHYTIANTTGYVVSFVFNYIASTRFTFRVKSTAKRGAGFVFSHIINYLLQTAILSVAIYFGLEKRLALIPMFCICVPINFILVRYFLKKR